MAIKKILVRFPNWVGDVVMAEPVIAVLRENYPDAEIAVALREYCAEVLTGHPGIDRLIRCQDKNIKGLKKLVDDIKDFRPELALILPNSFRSLISVRWAGVKNIVGYRRGLRKFWLQGPEAPKENGRYQPVPMTDYFLKLCQWMQLQVAGSHKPRLYLTPQETATGQALLRQYGIADQDLVFALNPGAQFGSSKCWPDQYFARLGELLQNQFQCRLFILVGPGEEEIADKIVQQSKAEFINTGPDRVGLGVLKALVQRSNLVITNDTGPRHYAVAFDKPVVVLMGPTDPRHTHCHLDKTIVLREELPCSPCHLKVCPIDHPCMLNLTPEKVFSAVQQIMN